MNLAVLNPRDQHRKQKALVLRVNRDASPGHLPTVNDLAALDMRRSHGKYAPYAPRERDPGEVRQSTTSVWSHPNYVPPPATWSRPGADDHLQIKSLPFGT